MYRFYTYIISYIKYFTIAQATFKILLTEVHKLPRISKNSKLVANYFNSRKNVSALRPIATCGAQ